MADPASETAGNIAAMTSPAKFPAAFVRPWTELLRSHQAEQRQDFPNAHACDPESLITTSSPQTLLVGTGLTIFQRGILPAMLDAKLSIHLVTCYWAASPSLDAIRDGLTQLAASRQSRGTTCPPLRVSIGFSSWGLLQKLFHTSCTAGEAYPPSQWSKLGLPDERTLVSGGIQLTVKSLFFRPMSVMHPKYVLVDGSRAFMPSCNVSWERWFEGCVEVQGDVVSSLAAFHRSVWGDISEESYSESMSMGPRGEHHTGNAGQDDFRHIVGNADGAPHGDDGGETDGFLPEDETTSAARSLKVNKAGAPIPTILLPSPHHRNPRFSFFPFLSHSDPPMTPLNAALLTLFANARRDITILTPNVTSWPVLDALLEALARGVNVQIRTNRGMMLIEQLVTAGTTTSWCLKKFIKKYQKLLQQQRQSDTEAQPVSPGTLEILYYKSCGRRDGLTDEPVVSHFKMTMVDDEYLVLGSGNMDRASWWTSQELGVLFYVPGTDWHRLWDGVLEKRTELLYRSA
ncbi:hypothetical protein E4U43_007795 [Claviceps pusilla]|uniref:PLD phosphodiesterase domain-containing protein n=1 Tax=Claviceps pusilla TaxID=123648 RepID=A0A9P7NBV8_9HYPO|nr:hypothetical protein E4U43_007795 [Claviceps pusilla]